MRNIKNLLMLPKKRQFLLISDNFDVQDIIIRNCTYFYFINNQAFWKFEASNFCIVPVKLQNLMFVPNFISNQKILNLTGKTLSEYFLDTSDLNWSLKVLKFYKIYNTIRPQKGELNERSKNHSLRRNVLININWLYCSFLIFPF
jgi:hypothetical protein